MNLASRRLWTVLLAAVALLALVTQLQPLYLRFIGAVDGTFGLRPISHACAGLRPTGEWLTAHLAAADWQGKVGYFSIRYHVPKEAGDREFCLGQDIWFGE